MKLRLVENTPRPKPKRKDPFAIARKRMAHLKGIEVVKKPLAWSGANFVKHNP